MSSDCPSILVVDDSADSRLLLQAILARQGWQTTEAVDGECALRHLAEVRPDLVLLDVMMPGRDGFEILAELNATALPPPVIFLSGRSDVAARVQGLNGGAVDFITKPFEPSEVVARVRTQLRLAELTRALSRANAALEERQRRLDDELHAAGTIQRRLIPKRPPSFPDVSVAWQFLPSTQVGGDLFQVLDLDGRHLAIFVVDVAGHGLPAALVTASVAQALSPDNGVLMDGDRPRRPGAVLRMLDQQFPIERFDRHFTITYALYDRHSGRLCYSSAGHPLPLLLSRERSEWLRAGGTIIGLGTDLPFVEGEIELAAGDRLYLYSDGLTETFAPSGEAFGTARLAQCLRAAETQSLAEACSQLVASARAFGHSQAFADDVTLVGLEFAPR